MSFQIGYQFLWHYHTTEYFDWEAIEVHFFLN
jgi:hypothetical protein